MFQKNNTKTYLALTKGDKLLQRGTVQPPPDAQKARHANPPPKQDFYSMLDVYVFSFNRGKFLAHCIKSIKSCAPSAAITILDDASTDPHTLETLLALQNENTIIRSENIQTEMKTGGLYGSMNAALEIAEKRHCEHALFIQDDMQLVRSLIPSDIERVKRFFDANRDAIQYQTCFQRRNSSERLKRLAFLDESKCAFLLPRDSEKGKDNFSAVGVFHIQRVREHLGGFAVGEGANSLRCRELGIRMGVASYPFMNWLPYPPSFRGRKRSITHRVIERLGGAGFHPIDLMSQTEEERFLNKDPSVVPVAEDWLAAPAAPRHDFWSTGGGEYNLVARGGLPATAFRAAVWSKRKLLGKRR